MFIPSMYKSAPQVVSFSYAGSTWPQDITIPSAVNPSYTRVTLQGWASANASGFVPPGNCRYTLLNGTTIRIYEVAGITAPATFVATFLVEEYIPFFLRQPVHYNSGIILFDQTQVTVNTGLTLSSKAFVLFLGCIATDQVSQVEADEANCRVSLNTGTGIVTITRIGTFEDGGNLTCNFAVIDPK